MITEKKYLLPSTLEEALDMAYNHKGNFKFIAGGTDVMVNRYQGNEQSPCLIDLTKIESLKGIETNDHHIRIGSLVTLDALNYSTQLKSEFSMLIEAANSVGSPLIRKTATIGGNILCENRCIYYNQSEWWREAVGYCLKCNGTICIATQGKKACFSEIVSDTAPAIAAMDGLIEFIDEQGVHQQRLELIYTGDGVVPRNLPENAIVSAIIMPRGRGFKTVFNKLRERESLEFTSLTSAVSCDKDGKIKIALSGVDPKLVIMDTDINHDKDDLIKTITKKARAIDNDMYTRKYRREMIAVYLKRSLEIIKSN